MHQWNNYKLGECIKLNYGKSLPQNKRHPGMYPVFGSNGIIGYHNQYLVNGPGVIIGRKGSVGEITYSKTNFFPIDTTYYVECINDNLIRFWYYLLQTCRLYKMNTHAAVPGLNRDEVYRLERQIPPLNEQKAIAKILSDLDSKIELLQEQNKTLEAIGQAIFKHWFIDFEFPNKDGKPYKSSGGKMVESEMGNIPEGWEIGKISDIVNIISGYGFSSKLYTPNGEYGLVTIKNVQNGIFIKDCTNRIDDLPVNMKSEQYLSNGDILLSLTGNVGRICYVHSGKYLLNQRVAKLVPKKSIFKEFLYLLFRTNIMNHMMIELAKGSAQPNLSPVELGNQEISIPNDEIILNFSDYVSAMYSKEITNSLEESLLTQLRDFLLPKLMSGQIRVPLGYDNGK